MKVNNLFYIIFFLSGFFLSGILFGKQKNSLNKKEIMFTTIDKNECDALLFEEKMKTKKILENSSKVVNYILLLDLIDSFKDNFYHKRDLFLQISEILNVIQSDGTFLFLRKKYSHLNKQDIKSLENIINLVNKELDNKKFFGVTFYSNKRLSNIALLIKIRTHLRNNDINLAINVLNNLPDKDKYQHILNELLKLQSVFHLCEEIKMAIRDKFSINYNEEF